MQGFEQKDERVQAIAHAKDLMNRPNVVTLTTSGRRGGGRRGGPYRTAFKPRYRPVQRRLHASEIDLMAVGYRAGRLIRAIASALGLHHSTVTAHLEQLGVQRRTNGSSSG